MKKIVLAACLAAFALATGSVMAQPKSSTPGSAEEQMNKPTGSKGAATKEEKAAARAKRNAEAKAAKKGSVGASEEAMNKSAGTAKAATSEEKAAAKTARKEAGKAPAKVGAGAAEEASQKKK